MENLLLGVLAETIHNAPIPKPWISSKINANQHAILEQECSAPSEFDQLHSRKSFYALYKSGHIQPIVQKTEGGTVVALLEHPSQVHDIPWALWSQILQMFKRPDGESYTVYVCAHPALRKFPHHSHKVEPLHINGGYTYPCKSSCVFIYRAEDATRVLIHELFHAACSDNRALSLEEREAETEAWAELFWCGFMSGGDLKSLKSCVQKQANWIVSQNRRLTDGNHYEEGVNGFPWRYTTGKELLWKRWNLMEHAVPHSIDSMRLTFKPTAAMKKMYGVRPTSTML